MAAACSGCWRTPTRTFERERQNVASPGLNTTGRRVHHGLCAGNPAGIRDYKPAPKIGRGFFAYTCRAVRKKRAGQRIAASTRPSGHPERESLVFFPLYQGGTAGPRYLQEGRAPGQVLGPLRSIMPRVRLRATLSRVQTAVFRGFSASWDSPAGSLRPYAATCRPCFSHNASPCRSFAPCVRFLSHAPVLTALLVARP